MTPTAHGERHPKKTHAVSTTIAGKERTPARSASGSSRGNGEESPLPGLYEVNLRCIEMLVNAARTEQEGSFALVTELREVLKSLDPAMRERSARCTLCLVDMELGNSNWWHMARRRPSQPIRTSPWRGSFPRPSAIQLARALLLLAWNNLRTDPATAQALLGMTAPVAETIASLRIDELDPIAQARFRHMRPRWDDRPATWRRLILAAQTADAGLLHEFILHALQLLTGELLPTPELRASAVVQPFPKSADGRK
jgi:hypothetical protein